ncbi:MAG: DHA2 family efflux MFS transporter permease subunit [Actinophytocola sp.]|uniref:DHA2 family efflux MFS transporter permease subunit n=1 Tax=Actinophytocola sp. TaxID=1872138 RepID=UPI003C724523
MTTETDQSSPGAQDGAVRLPPALRRVILVTLLGSFMANLDSTIVNVGLNTIAGDLDSSLADIQWLVTAYLLAMAAVIPITGWLAVRFGATRLYVVATVVFTAASLACAVATDATQLIVFRALQGIGGGMCLPIAQMLLVGTAGPKLLARAMSVNAAPTLLAPIIGPTLGGLLIQHAGWRWIFFVNVPIGVVTVGLALWLLTREAPRPAGRVDLPGFALLTTGSVAVTFGLAEIGGTGRLGAPVVLVACGAGVVLLALFVWHALRASNPLLDLRLFKNKVYSAASLTNACVGATVFGAIILLPLYFQIVRGEDQVSTGLLLIPQGTGAAIAIWFGARLIERFGAGMTTLIGGVVGIVSTLPFVFVQADTSLVWLGVVMFVRGVGIGLVVVPATAAAYRAIPPARIQDASVQMNVGQRLGGSVGAAVLTVVLQQQVAGATTPEAAASGFGTAFAWVVGVAVVATIPAILLASAERKAARTAA